MLEATLEENGIAVIHDKTLHDNPSYNNSYSRSYETVTALLKISDDRMYHRPAPGRYGSGEWPAEVEKVNGKTCSVYSYVLSNTTNTYSANKAFLDRLNGIAAADYGGYTGIFWSAHTGTIRSCVKNPCS